MNLYWFRNVTSYIQISLLKGEQLKQEEVVAQAEEDLHVAKFPTSKVTDVESYFKLINTREQSLENAKESVENIKKSIAKYEDLKKEYSTEVESKEDTKAE